ncbi:MAG: GGDEF domain-containing protein [Epsilonproteobacteria bacterium]|nr:GGDEF domain-containing protein [Campylobacterota bacterium]
MATTQIQILLNILEEITTRYDEIFEIKEKMFQEAHFKSTHDPLTHLYNREFLMQKLKEFMKNKHHFALVFLDLDNFKYVNDTFGHKMGDELLKKTAQILRNNLKGKDVIARFGGDEFVILLPETTKEEAQKIFSHIKDEIAKTFNMYKVTSSVGISEFPEIEDLEELLTAADEKMYQSKKSGKNRVSI